MRYTFLDFEFDSNNLILSKNGDDIDIRPNEAKLLALLLSDSTQVFSKDAILTKVWHDKGCLNRLYFKILAI
ncbi:winged helix-turn-helix domain-containing protein [uncultured Pseudoalteromonas sp.]|uniref:winged helix-turn-helix domain-containing protein n=1 Tax=uncultured Pseudoalteromonas sp. TaxID=114053 RepID=UPI0030D765BF|tara:strand:+ start:4978 stop:5193 length:216 start_codon:yes stop_codon:yes gene_type:complete